jgi:hypothetical protein
MTTSVMQVGRNGTSTWRVAGVLHRTDGPAIEHANGAYEWWENGVRHRDGGPAVKETTGNLYWYQRGELHRTGGPACDGCKLPSFWVRGTRVGDIDDAALLTSLSPEDVEKVLMLYSRGTVVSDLIAAVLSAR